MTGDWRDDTIPKYTEADMDAVGRMSYYGGMFLGVCFACAAMLLGVAAAGCR